MPILNKIRKARTRGRNILAGTAPRLHPCTHTPPPAPRVERRESPDKAIEFYPPPPIKDCVTCVSTGVDVRTSYAGVVRTGGCCTRTSRSSRRARPRTRPARGAFVWCRCGLRPSVGCRGMRRARTWGRWVAPLPCVGACEGRLFVFFRGEARCALLKARTGLVAPPEPASHMAYAVC